MPSSIAAEAGLRIQGSFRTRYLRENLQGITCETPNLRKQSFFVSNSFVSEGISDNIFQDHPKMPGLLKSLHCRDSDHCDSLPSIP